MTTMKKVISLAFLAVLLTACGGEAEYQALWQSILAHLLEILVVIATPLIMLLARKLMLLLEEKTGLDIAEKHESMLLEYVARGVAFAEEQGHKALKTGKPPLSGDEKKIMAVEFVAEQINALGLPEMGRDALEKLVESALNMQRK